MAATPLQIEAPFTVGAQLEARAEHPDVAERIAIRSGDRSWTFRRFRDDRWSYPMTWKDISTIVVLALLGVAFAVYLGGWMTGS